jgi:nucleotide-binding universal stress UspA family protein
MSDQVRPLAIHRILVALDESAHSAAALEAAADLAHRLQAELQALFVEDANLLRLASLPFAREVIGASAAARPLDAAAMERALRAQAARVQANLAAAAQRFRVRYTFSVVRGAVVSELLAHSLEVDLLVVGAGGGTGLSARRLGSVARGVGVGASCTVLMMHQGSAVGRPVVVLFDGTEAGARALMLGARLAEADSHNLVVALPGSEQTAAKLERQATELLQAAHSAARFRRLSGGSAEELAALVTREGGRVLLLEAAGAFAEAGDRGSLAEAVECPVVLVR